MSKLNFRQTNCVERIVCYVRKACDPNSRTMNYEKSLEFLNFEQCYVFLISLNLTFVTRLDTEIFYK